MAILFTVPAPAPAPLGRALLLAVVLHAVVLTLVRVEPQQLLAAIRPSEGLTLTLVAAHAPAAARLQAAASPARPAPVIAANRTVQTDSMQTRSATPALAATATPPAPTTIAAAPLAESAPVNQGKDKAATSAPASETVTPPQFHAAYLNNPQPDYPLLSRKLQEEGRVVLQVRVSSAGLPLDIQLRQSSGFSRLDQAALQKIREWRFVPARLGSNDIEGTVLVPLTFRLSQPA